MKIVNKLLQEIANLAFEYKARSAVIKQKVNFKVPNVCQFARPEHAELSLRKQLAPAEDPYWEESGARSPERYADWAFTMCGMASAAMAIGYFNNEDMKPVHLAEDALRTGVYTEERGGISNMKYKEFAHWLRTHKLKAKVYSRLSTRGIRSALSEGQLVIISVNPNIRGYDTAPAGQIGGHLVVATGYDLVANTMSINNPSGFVSTDTQVNHTLSISEFGRYFAGRGIVISPIDSSKESL